VSLEFTHKRKFIFPEGMTRFILQYAAAWIKTGVRKFRRRKLFSVIMERTC